MKVSSTIDQLLNNQDQTKLGKAGDNSYMGKEDFLLLLVTQMQHQNPLDPVSNEEFAAQLAQFSSLEQLTNMNENLELSAKTNAATAKAVSNSLAASLIGKRVLAENNKFYFSQEHQNVLGFKLSDTAKNVTVRIKTQVGNILYEEDLGAMSEGNNSVTWDGKDLQGNIVADGAYIFEVEAYGVTDEDVLESTLTSGIITGVRYRDGESYLVVDNIEIPMSEVKEIVEGSSS